MAVLIAGPTASGKSALALALAAAHGGVVVNADAMQVYRDLTILTARPSPADEAAVPHALYGTVDAADAHSLAAWLAAVRPVLTAAHAAGRIPVVVGGTGLYLAALTEGLSQIPPIPQAVRAHWRAQQDVKDSGDLHDILRVRDPVMAARLRRSDPQRIVRALEVIEATGRSLAHWQAERVPGPLDGAPLTRFVIAPDRTALRARIARRFEKMVDAGGVEEAAALLARGLDPSLPAVKAIGVRELGQYAAGRLGRSEAVERAVTLTRQYAKRQETFFRHRFADWRHIEDANEGLAHAPHR